MTFALKLLTFALSRPQKTLTLGLVFFILSGFAFASSFSFIISRHLSKGLPHPTLFNEEESSLAYQDDLIVVLRNPGNTKGVFSPDYLQKVNQFCSAWKRYSGENPAHPRLLATDYLGICNVDMVSETTLGSAPLTPLLPEQFTFTDADIDQLIQKMNHNIFFKDLIISKGNQSTALYLPLYAPGTTAALTSVSDELVRRLELQPDQVCNAGLALYRETLFHQGHRTALLSSLLAGCLIWIGVALVNKKASHGIVILLPTANATLAVLLVQTATGMREDIFLFTTPALVAATTLIQALCFAHRINNSTKWSPKEPEKIISVLEPLLPAWLRLMYALIAACLSIGLLAPSPLLNMAMILAVGITMAWFMPLFFVPAGLVVFGPTKRKNKPTTSYLLPPERPENTFHFPYVDRLVRNYSTVTFAAVSAFTLACAFSTALLKQQDTLISWYGKNHHFQRAEQLINKNFAGAYKLILRLEASDRMSPLETIAGQLKSDLFRPLASQPDIRTRIMHQIDEALAASTSKAELYHTLAHQWEQELNHTLAGDILAQDLWSIALDSLAAITYDEKPFSHPDILRYIDQLSLYLRDRSAASKVFSIVDLTKKMHQDLYDGATQLYSIPATTNAVLQTWQQYGKGNHPESFSRFINSSYNAINILLILKDPRPKTLQQLQDRTLQYLQREKPPIPLKISWQGSLQDHITWSHQLSLATLLRWGTFLLTAAILFGAFTQSLISGSALLGTGVLNLIITLGMMGLLGIPISTASTALIGLPLLTASISTWYILYSVTSLIEDGASYGNALKQTIEHSSFPLLLSCLCITGGGFVFAFCPYTLFHGAAFIGFTSTLAACLTALLLLPSLGWLLYREAEIQLSPAPIRGKPAPPAKIDRVTAEPEK